MPASIRTTARALDAAKASLIEQAFHEGPLYRQGFDDHVRKWSKHVSARVFVLYHTEREFQEAYDARRHAVRVNAARLLDASTPKMGVAA